MNVWQKIKTVTEASTVIQKLLVLLIPLGTILVATYVQKEQETAQAVSTKTSLRLLLLVSLLELGTLGYVWYLRRKYVQKMRSKFTVLWDKDLVAHCPDCEKPLSKYSHWYSSQRWGFECRHCTAKFNRQLILYLDDENGKNITLEEAKNRLKSR